MPRNIEIKARIESVEALLPLVSSISERGPFEIVQDDTFFTSPSGRLKLRVFSPHEGELIFYQRPDQGGPKESRYSISKTTAPATLRELLSQALGEVGGVEKHRTLFLIGRTRIHLDRVKGLGDFLELEVVLGEHEAPQAGIDEAQKLMAKLGVKPSQLVHGAYLDLMPSEDSER